MQKKTSLFEEVYSFKAQWFDHQAQLLRPYNLRYFIESHCVEIIDGKSNKLFLKKTACPATITSKDFFLGAKVLIYGRNFELIEYMDKYTKDKLDTTSQKSVAIIHNSIIPSMGKILDSFIRNGLRISALRMLKLEPSDTAKILEKHQGESYFTALINSVSNNPLVAVEVVGEDSIAKMKQIIGPLRSRYSQGNNDYHNGIEVTENALDTQLHQKILFGTKGGHTAKLKQCTCCIIQPHAIREGKTGQIIDSIQQEGYEITAMQMFQLDRAAATEFLEVYDGVVPYLNDMIDQYVSGPCIAIEIYANDAVDSFRQTAGPWDIEIAKELRPESIRSRFGLDRVKNGIHCTDLPDDGELECQYFFDILARK